MHERRNALESLFAVAAASLLTGCIWQPGDCGPGPERVTMPSGEFAPAALYVNSEGIGEPLFTGTFPRGVTGSLPDGAQGGAGGLGGASGSAGAAGGPPTSGTGTFIPSAKLRIDRPGRLVTRTYVDAQGRTVEELWTFK
jgi:hypothetical protein